MHGSASPYATGGGGTSLERRVAAVYLARMLTGTTTPECRDRQVRRVTFQHAGRVDDLAVLATDDDGRRSLKLHVAVRRKPAFVASDEDTRKLVGALLAALDDFADQGVDGRVAVVVAGQQDHAQQVALLAHHAYDQHDADAFAALIREPGRFQRSLVARLDHLQELVQAADPTTSSQAVAEATWRLLAHLDVLMPRLEPPDTTDWMDLTNLVMSSAAEPTATMAAALRDRLEALPARYAPHGADVDIHLLRRDLARLVRADDPEARDRSERVHAESIARSSARLDTIGLDAALLPVITDSVAQTVPEGLATVAEGVLTVVTGPPGSGKTELGEWWFRTQLAEEGATSRRAVWLSARTDGPVLAERLQVAIRCTDVAAVDVVLDGIDEVAPHVGADLLDTARTFVRMHPASRFVVTTRPGTPLGNADAHVAMTGLDLADAARLFESLTGRPGHHLHGWPKVLTDSLRWPLWVALAAVASTEDRTPRSSSDLLDRMVQRALRRAREARTVSMPATYQRLKRVAVAAVEAAGPIPIGEAGGYTDRQDLLATGLVRQDGPAIGFTLPIIEQWLAAQAVVDGDADASVVTVDIAAVARWRYPLAVALASGSAGVVDEVMTRLTVAHVGLASWVIDIVEANFMPSSGRVDEHVAARRLHAALVAIDDTAVHPRLRVLPVDAHGGRAALAVSASRRRLGLMVAPGGRTDGTLTVITEFDRPAEKGWEWHLRPLDARPCGVWLAAFDLLWKRTKNFLKHAPEDMLGVSSLADAELRWAMCRSLSRYRSSSADQPDADDVIEECDRLVAEVDAHQLDDTSFRLGKGTYRLHHLRWLRESLHGAPRGAASPAPEADLEHPSGAWVWSFYSDHQLLERVQWSYRAALDIYRDLVAAWYPTLQDVLGLSCVRPVQIRGHLKPPSGPDLEHGPVLRYVVLPGEKGAIEDSVVIGMTSDSGPTDASWMPFEGQFDEASLQRIAQWREHHPLVSAYARFSASWTVLDIYGERPATKIALKWLIDDLHRLGFDDVRPEL